MNLGGCNSLQTPGGQILAVSGPIFLQSNADSSCVFTRGIFNGLHGQYCFAELHTKKGTLHLISS